MKASDILIAKLKEFEGCKLKAYKCPAGVWTIGYGTTKGVYAGMEITYAEAEKMLRKDLAIFETFVNGLNVCKTQGQFDALVDFAYNVGCGNLATSTLLKKVRAGVNSSTLVADFGAIPDAYFGGRDKRPKGLSKNDMFNYIVKYQLSRWNKANGIPLDGLIKRRAWEGKRWAE